MEVWRGTLSHQPDGENRGSSHMKEHIQMRRMTLEKVCYFKFYYTNYFQQDFIVFLSKSSFEWEQLYSVF